MIRAERIAKIAERKFIPKAGLFGKISEKSLPIII